jgi:hypothetical protein
MVIVTELFHQQELNATKQAGILFTALNFCKSPHVLYRNMFERKSFMLPPKKTGLPVNQQACL